MSREWLKIEVKLVLSGGWTLTC